MSINNDTLFRLKHAVTDADIANEIAVRLSVASAPSNAAAAQAILDSFDLSDSMSRSIEERLKIALAGDGSQGAELAKKINLMIDVLQAQANGDDVAAVAAQATLDLTADIILTSVAAGSARNTNTLTLQIAAAAANPTNTILAGFTGTAAAITLTITPNDGTNNPANVAAQATLDLTADIILTSVAAGAGRNTNTLTLQVLAAAANPTDTVLVDFTGTAAAIVCTVTPNDGTNNGATPVDLTTAELVELINSGSVVGKNVTLTDASSRRILQTATGGGATALVDAGEGDGVVATFSGGTTVAINITTAQVRELINSGSVVGKSVTLTDASSRRILQTATGGGATNVADSGEGDGVVATFSGGANSYDIDIAPAQSAMGSEHLSSSNKFHLQHALTSDLAASNFEASYNAMVDAIQAI